MHKNIIRKKVLALRSNLEEEKKKLDNIIFRSVVENDIYINSNKIFIYVSYNNEVDTREIIKYSLNNNKSVYVPKINIKDKTMKAIKIHNLNELDVNKYGIMEPNIVDKNYSEEEFDIIVMPGIAFDRHGNRIGYGGGYYDKYISDLNYDVVKIALAYNFQLVDYIEPEEHDVKVNYILTDKEVIYIK